MPDAETLAELRSLQERAYGRAGGLSEADVARLAELEHSPVPERAATHRHVEPSTPPISSPVVERGPTRRDEGPSTPPVSSPDVERGSEATGRRAERGSKPRRWVIPAAIVIAILLGVLLGWVLFSPRAPQPVPLSAEQQSWQDDILASAVYDPGSVRAIGEEDGTIIWFATRDDGGIVCAIISDGVTTAPACREHDAAMMLGIQTSLRREVEGGEGLVDAQVQFDAEGDPAVLSSNSLIGGGRGGGYANETEQRTAELLMASGYTPTSLTVVGHDGDVPLWTGLDIETGRWCLIYDGSSAPVEAACDDDGTQVSSGGSLGLTRVDVDAGTSTTFEYRFGPGAPYLEITRNSDGSAS
jgi:hypothetical protein